MRRAAKIDASQRLVTVKFFLRGKVPSKKNSKMLCRGRLITKPVYQAQLRDLETQAALNYIGPSLTDVCVDLHFHISNRRQDIDNAVSGAMDVLKNASVIVDDSMAHVKCIFSTFKQVPKGDEGVLVAITGREAITAVLTGP